MFSLKGSMHISKVFLQQKEKQLEGKKFSYMTNIRTPLTKVSEYHDYTNTPTARHGSR
jgi:hypothetical protein